MFCPIKKNSSILNASHNNHFRTVLGSTGFFLSGISLSISGVDSPFFFFFFFFLIKKTPIIGRLAIFPWVECHSRSLALSNFVCEGPTCGPVELRSVHSSGIMLIGEAFKFELSASKPEAEGSIINYCIQYIVGVLCYFDAGQIHLPRHKLYICA